MTDEDCSLGTMDFSADLLRCLSLTPPSIVFAWCDISLVNLFVFDANLADLDVVNCSFVVVFVVVVFWKCRLLIPEVLVAVMSPTSGQTPMWTASSQVDVFLTLSFNVYLLADRTAHSPIGYWHYTVVCVLRLNDTSYSKSVWTSE